MNNSLCPVEVDEPQAFDVPMTEPSNWHDPDDFDVNVPILLEESVPPDNSHITSPVNRHPHLLLCLESSFSSSDSDDDVVEVHLEFTTPRT